MVLIIAKTFRDSLMNRSLKEQHLFEIEIFCNIINVFTFTFNQFNAPLLNKSINFFVFPYLPETFEL